MKLTLSLILLAAAAFAQRPFAGTAPASVISDVKTYLSLTDTQVTALQTIVKQQQTTVDSVRQQIQTKQTSLDALLNGNSADAAAVGRLMLDIQSLRKQIDTNATSLRAQAVAVLTADQKTKLAALDAAAKLRATIQQATSLLLLTPPTPPAGANGPGRPMGFRPPREF